MINDITPDVFWNIVFSSNGNKIERLKEKSKGLKNFILDDYKLINTDLKFESDIEYRRHFTKRGIVEGRLFNKKQLIVDNDLERELIVYIPYYNYLRRRNLLLSSQINTFKNMRPYYFFLNDEQLIESSRARRRVPDINNPLIYNYSPLVEKLDVRFWCPPDYKSHFKNEIFVFVKTPLIITDTRNIISLPILTQMFGLLKDIYQIIYVSDVLRPDLLPHIELHDVITIQSLMENYPNIDQTTLRLKLYANCDNFICTKNELYFHLYFAKKLLVFRENGYNYHIDHFRSFYQVCPKNELIFRLINTDNQLLTACHEFFIDNQSKFCRIILKEFGRNINNIFLVASRTFTKEEVEKYNKLTYASPQSLIVRFNRCVSNKEIFNGKTHIRFFMGMPSLLLDGYKLDGHTGPKVLYIVDSLKNKEIIKKNNKLEKLFSYNDLILTTQYRNMFSDYQCHKKIDTCKYAKIVIEKYPSTGMVALHNLLKVYPKCKIHLIGFSFTGYVAHAWNIEKYICENVLKENIVLYN